MARALFPSRRLPREARRQLRLAFRRGLRLASRGRDLAFELFLVGKSRELIHEEQRLLGRDFEFPSAGPADDLILDTKQVVPQLRELGAVFLARPGRQPILPRAPDPSHAVVGGPPALRALITGLPGFRPVGPL